MLRPDANATADRSFCHTYGRGHDHGVMIPGWPYSIVAALERRPTSWTALLDAVRLARELVRGQGVVVSRKAVALSMRRAVIPERRRQGR